MAEVRRIECKDVEGRDFAPSEMYLVVLTQDENQILCKYADNYDHENQPALQSIINGTFSFLKEFVD